MNARTLLYMSVYRFIRDQITQVIIVALRRLPPLTLPPAELFLSAGGEVESLRPPVDGQSAVLAQWRLG